MLEHEDQSVCGDYVSFDEDIKLVFGEGEKRKSVSLIIMNDDVPEDKEMFSVFENFRSFFFVYFKL